jgi:hypothetical protein
MVTSYFLSPQGHFESSLLADARQDEPALAAAKMRKVAVRIVVARCTRPHPGGCVVVAEG